MKILLTGFTQRMVNSQRLRYDYLTSVQLLYPALQKLGHDVDWREVKAGEDPSGYDLALVGVCPPKSVTARHVAGACYAMGSLKTLLYADDWSVEAMAGNAQSALRCMDRWAPYMKFNDLERSCVTQGLDEMLQGRWPLLAPMFPWGDHRKLLAKGLQQLTCHGWDPTPLSFSLALWNALRTMDPHRRIKRWIYGTLQDHDKWLHALAPKWDVKSFGSYRAGDGYIAESELVSMYYDSWGVLCPQYKTAGSGWWRMRYVHSALAGCILKGGADDMCAMGLPYQHFLHEIERMDTGELYKLAEAQRDWFFAHVNTCEQTLKQLEEVIR